LVSEWSKSILFSI